MSRKAGPLRHLRSALVALLTALLLFALASPARASETFGVESFASSIASNTEGASATQAGSHPYALTTTVMFNHQVTGEEEDFKENEKGVEVPLGEPEVFAHIYGSPRDLEVNLPSGLVVDPAATSVKCTEAQLETSPSSGGACPAASAVGVVTVYIAGLGEKIKGAVYNMTPPTGIPAELGVDPGGVGLVMHIVGKIRSGGDYGFSADVVEIAQTTSIYGLELTLWGDPSAASHDAQRGVCASRGKVQKAIEEELFEAENLKNGKSTEEFRFSCPVERTGTPLLTLPGSCTGEPLTTTLSVDSWQAAHRHRTLTGDVPARDGLRRLGLHPIPDREAGARSRERGIPDGPGRRPEGAPRRKHGRAGRGGPEAADRDAAAGHGDLAVGGERTGGVRSDRSRIVSGIVEDRRSRSGDAAARRTAEGRGVSGAAGNARGSAGRAVRGASKAAAW